MAHLPLAPGSFVKTLENLGYKLAVLSGGFIPLANYVKTEFSLDYAYANQVCLHLLWILLLTK